jgi:hypothetical protein
VNGGLKLEVQYIENNIRGFFSFTPGFSQVTQVLHQAGKPFKRFSVSQQNRHLAKARCE